MSKKFIRNAAAISIIALILGAIITLTGSTNSTLGIVLLPLGIIILIIGSIAGLISYFGALVKTAKMRRMGWFIGILLFGVTAALIYGLVGPELQISNEAMPLFLLRSYKKTKKTLGV